MLGLSNENRALPDDEIVLHDRYHGGTYGIPDASTLEAMRLIARLEGMITDPVYEGEVDGRTDRFGRPRRVRAGLNVLYAHLGGQPALSAYAGLFRE